MASIITPPSDDKNNATTEAKPSDGSTEAQAELYARYIEQQRRTRCVGCGEAEEIF